MPNAAAHLQVVVDANTRGAVRGLQRTDRQLHQTARTAGTTHRAFTRAAKAVAGLGGAYVALHAAKGAIDDTTELAKSTLTLHKNLGFSVKSASEWAAVMKARGADTTKVNMAFKALSTQVRAAGDGTKSAVDGFNKLGISQKELAHTSPEKLMGKIADGLHRMGPGFERNAIGARLFGRGFASIIPLLRDGSAKMNDQLKLAGKYGATFGGKTIKSMQDWIQAQREAKIATLGLKVSFATAVIPTLTRVIRTFSRVKGVLNDKNLTGEQKWQRIQKIIAPLATSMQKVIEDAMPKIANAVGKNAPKVAESFVKGFMAADVWGKAVLAAFLITKLGGVKAWTVIGTKLGAGLGLGIGEGANTGAAAAGTRYGRTFAAAIPLGMAGAVTFIGNEIGKKINQALGVAGKMHVPGGPGALGAQSQDFIDSAQKTWESAKKAYHSVIGSLGGLPKLLSGAFHVPGGVGSLGASSQDFTAAAKKTWDAIKKAFGGIFGSSAGGGRGGGGGIAAIHLPTLKLPAIKMPKLPHLKLPKLDTGGIVATAKRVSSSVTGTLGDMWATVRRQFRVGTSRVGGAFGDMGSGIKRISGRIKSVMTGSLGDAWATVRRLFRVGASRAGDAFGNMGSGVKRIAHGISRAVVRMAQVVGGLLDFVHDKFNKLIKSLHGSSLPSIAIKAGKSLLGKQRGGHINQGAPSGDSVPAMLERGEYVLNRKAVRKVGKRRLDAVNYGEAPRFQQGGPVGYQRGGLHSGISNLVGAVQNKFPGLAVTSTTGGNHHPGSYHYRGLAADMASGNYQYMNEAAKWIRGRYGRSLTEGIHNPNLSIKYGKSVSPGYWGADTWAGHANHIHLAVAGMLKALGIGGAGQIARQAVSGRGPMAGIARALEKRARGAANKRLGQFSSPDEQFSGSLGHFSKGKLKNLWTGAGGPGKLANTAAAIALSESGGNPAAHNKSGASGLWQILGQIVPGNIFNPKVNAKNAVAKWRGAGNSFRPWVQYTTGAYRQYLQKGGMVGMQTGGATAPRRTTHRARGPVGEVHRVRTPHPGRDVLTLRGKSVRDILKDTHRMFGLYAKGHPRQAGRIYSGLKGTLGKMGAGIGKSIPGLQSSANLYGGFGERADTLGGDTGAGMIAGHTGREWYQAQLDTLWTLRNRMIAAVQAMRQRQAILHSLAETFRARWHHFERLKKLYDRRLAHPPKGLRGKPLREWKKATRATSKTLGRRANAAKGLLGAAKSRYVALGGKVTDLISGGDGNSLTDIQGDGAPMTAMKKLPSPWIWGGSLFDTQQKLAPAAATATDTAPGAERLQSIVDLLKQQLQQSNLRTALSESAFRVFQDLPYAGSFQTMPGQARIVPGSRSQAQIATVHGGETIGRPGPVQVTVVVEKGAGVDESKIRVIAQDETGKTIRSQVRRTGRTPGRAGT